MALDADRVHLAELLAALAVVGLVLAAIVSVFGAGQRAYTEGAARVETQQSARIALARMTREIRQAGRGGDRFPPFATADPTRLVLQQDLDGNEVVATRGETITWSLVGGVLRRDAGAGAQPIVNGVRALGLAYLDAAGRPTGRLDAIRSVVITLTTEPDGSGSRGAARTTLTTEVRLRNR